MFFIVNCQGEVVGNRAGYHSRAAAGSSAEYHWDIKEACNEALAQLQKTKPSATVAYTVQTARELHETKHPRSN